MRVLILNDLGTLTGGAELMSAAFRDELRARGHETLMLTSDSGQTASIADVTCFGSSTAVGTLVKTANPFAAWALRKTLRSFQPDIVHVRMFMTHLSPLILPLLKGVPTVYHAVSYETLCPTVNKVLPDGAFCQEPAGRVCLRSRCLSAQAWSATMIQRGLFMRWKDAFDLVVANGRVLAEHLEENGFPCIEVIGNGVPAAPPRPPLCNPPTLTFAGRLVSIKGVDVLLQAYQSVVKAIPEARLLIAGAGPEARNLIELTQQLDLHNHVSWLGQLEHDRVGERLANGWVHVVPSRVETFGLSATEAMMRGTAVVASRAGGLIDQVEHGLTGYLIPPEDTDALAATIIPLLQDRTLCEQMGAAARLRAIRHFAIESCTDKFEQVYERLTQ